MKSLTPKLLGIALLFALSFTYAFPWNAVGITPPFAQSNYKLGLDLNGWVELDYSVDVSAEVLSGSTQRTNEVVEGLKSIIEKRVNSLGTAEPTIVTQSYGGEPHIVVQIPTLNLENEGLNDVQKSQRNAEFIQKAKSVIGNVVQLEFKEKKTTITDADKTERKKLAETFLKELTTGKFSFEIVAQKFKANHENISYFSGSGTKSEIPSEVQSVSFLAQKGPSSDFVIEETTGGASLSFDAKGKSVLTEGNKGYLVYKVTAVTQREIEKTTGTGAKAKKEIVKEPAYAYQALWISQQPSEWTIAKTASGQELDERYLQNANVSLNQVMQPQVELNFNSEGAKIFGELTGRLIGKQIAIFVGGEMLTAPTVNSVIPNGKAVITGNYSTEEAKALANNINTGIVPAPIYLTSERTIDAKIWADSLTIIARAGIIGLALVILFMVVVYRFCGLLSSVALIIYTFLILSILKFFWVVLTLSGIAGVILSIGLAIDANVLIFERMKEAIREGNGLARATLLGFEKSWTAIWDSHLTSITSAIVLFIFGVSLIKGFGLALLIGIALSLFTAMWVSRVLVLWMSRFMEWRERFFLGISKK